MQNSDESVVLLDVAVLQGGSQTKHLGPHEFKVVPSVGDRVLLATASPDGVDQYKVAYLEHSPGLIPRSDLNGPPRALVVVEDM